MVSQPNASRDQEKAAITSALLTSKLRVPVLPLDQLGRPHLLKLLRAENFKLGLFSAAPGYGKTSLAAAAAHERDLVAWVTLANNDNQPEQFWRYVTSALKTAVPDWRPQVEALLDKPEVDVKRLPFVLATDLSAVDRSLVLILDNYDVLKSAQIHSGIATLLTELPSMIQVWITTRIEPALNLARLRANGQLIELREPELRMSLEECAEFLRRYVHHPMSREEIELIAARTEGWAAGLRLAAFRLNNSPTAGSEMIHGHYREYQAYFEEEVLRGLSTDTRAFVLQTSILNPIIPEVAQTITQMASAPVVLRQLERTHCFVTPLDSHPSILQYHPLFAEALRTLLEDEQPEQVRELQQRAAEAYAARRELRPAINHALQAQDFDRAVQWIKKSAKVLLIEGELKLLRHWLERLPLQLLRTDAVLRTLEAWVRFLEGRWGLLETDVEILKAEVAEGSTGNSALLGELHVLHARITLLRLDFERTRDLVKQALQLLPTESVLMRGLAELTRGSVAYLTGNLSGAMNAFSEDYTGEEADRELVHLVKLANLAYIHAQLGQLQRARECYDRVAAILHLSKQPRYLRMVTGMLATGMGDLELEWNQLAQAERHLSEGLQLNLPWRHLLPSMPAYFLLARARSLLGDLAGAQQAIHLLEDTIYGAPYPFPLTYLRGLAVQFELSQGNLEAAQHWQRTSKLTIHDTPQPLQTFEYFILARILLAQNQPEGIVKFFDFLLYLARMLNFMRSALEVLTLQALALDMQGDHAAATNKLVEALRLAEPEDYRRMFLDKGEPMKRMLMHVRDEALAPYVTTLLNDFAKEVPLPSGSRLTILRPMLAEPLSEREQDVLRLIAGGYSNKRIAEELVISEGTVKTHVKNILRKLDTENRTEAVARARQIGLLDP